MLPVINAFKAAHHRDGSGCTIATWLGRTSYPTPLAGLVRSTPQDERTALASSMLAPSLTRTPLL
jgi:hypothetical protein